MDTHENHSVDAPDVRCAKCWDWMDQRVRARARRVPLFAHLKLEGLGQAVTATSLNLSAGGMALRVRAKRDDEPVDLVVPGAAVTAVVRLSHGHDELRLRSRVVWVGKETSDHQGHRVREVGLRFEGEQPQAIERVAEFVRTFQY